MYFRSGVACGEIFGDGVYQGIYHAVHEGHEYEGEYRCDGESEDHGDGHWCPPLAGFGTRNRFGRPGLEIDAVADGHRQEPENSGGGGE